MLENLFSAQIWNLLLCVFVSRLFLHTQSTVEYKYQSYDKIRILISCKLFDVVGIETSLLAGLYT